MIAAAAALGVDTVYCHFFKGFGLKHEHDEIERTKSFVKIARSHGVKVLGYCQFNSLYYEAMLEEVPDLADWTVRDMDGRIGTYGHYYRWSPCIESREFRNYLKKVIRHGIENVGLDGFHFDNSYARDCHCGRCQHAFRAYLAANMKNPREVCGLKDFRHVRIPPKLSLTATGQEWHDALQIWRQRFRHAQLAEFHREIFDFVKSFGSDRLVLHNPAFGRNEFETRGLDVSIGPQSCDFMMAENSRFIREEADGKLVTQVAAYKLGRRFGFRVFDSTWPKIAEVDWTEPRTGIPTDADSISRFYAQGMIYGDIAGCPWLVRSTKKGDGVILDDPLQVRLAGRAFSFYRQNRERLFDTVPFAHTHLLYSTETFYGWCYNAAGFQSFMEASEKLNRESVPYVIAAESDIAALNSGDLLVVPDARFLSRRLYRRLEDAGARGVKILALGAVGQYDENGHERALDDPIIGLKCVSNLVSEIPSELKVEISDRGVMAETQMNRRGEFVLHLLKPGNSETVRELRVVIDDRRAVGKAEIFSFEDGCSLGYAVQDESGRRILTVRNFRTMCSIVFAERSDI